MSIPREDWKWFGDVGHLIVGYDCRFHLTTLVGPYLVSTVGKYLPDAPVREILAECRGVRLEGKGDARRADFMRKIGYEEVGCDRLFETMVFEAGDVCQEPGCACGLPQIASMELDSRGYNTAGAATDGHMELCEDWAAKAGREQAGPAARLVLRVRHLLGAS